MTSSLEIIIVDKTGVLKSVTVKDFKEEDLFKKCGFKKSDGFIQQVEWKVKIDGTKYKVFVYAKMDGRANSENKYDFPPPIDNHLFFGSCAIIAKTDTNMYTDLSLELWNKIYEKLFGGFEDLSATAFDDEMEEDELADVPEEMKTKQGYLKDGFVVDSTDEEEDEEEDDSSEEDFGSELSEDSYE